MIDLHSHILPGLDDGARDIEMSLAMARRYTEQGVTCVACTPHILPGVYHNTGDQIRRAVEAMKRALAESDINLDITTGADNHIVPDFVSALHSGHLLTLGNTRYVLVEPPHHVAPPRLEELFFEIQSADYVPVLTHPERLSWIEDRYPSIVNMAGRGVWLQITSGALLGRFGRRPRYWAERILAEGRAQLLASDAHDILRRPPDLAEGRRAAELLIGSQETDKLVVTAPAAVLRDVPPEIPPRFGGTRAAPTASGDDDVHEIPVVGDRRGVLERVRGFFHQR